MSITTGAIIAEEKNLRGDVYQYCVARVAKSEYVPNGGYRVEMRKVRDDGTYAGWGSTGSGIGSTTVAAVKKWAEKYPYIALNASGVHPVARKAAETAANKAKLKMDTEERKNKAEIAGRTARDLKKALYISAVSTVVLPPGRQVVLSLMLSDGTKIKRDATMYGNIWGINKSNRMSSLSSGPYSLTHIPTMLAVAQEVPLSKAKTILRAIIHSGVTCDSSDVLMWSPGAKKTMSEIHDMFVRGYEVPSYFTEKSVNPMLPKRTLDTMSESISLSSPSGGMSKRSKAAASERLHQSLFGEGLVKRGPVQPSEAENLHRRASELRGLADRGMKPRAYRKEADMLDAKADRISVANPDVSRMTDANLLNEVRGVSPKDRLQSPYFLEYERRGNMRVGGQYVAPPPQAVVGIGGFEKSLSFPLAAKAIKGMNTQHMINGVPQTRKEYVEKAVAEGAVVGTKMGQRAIVFPDGSFMLQKDITKTAVDYAAYLTKKIVTNPQLPEPWTMTLHDYIKSDPTHIVGDQYRVSIAGRSYTELVVAKPTSSGMVVLDIFGDKYFKPGQYEKLNRVAPRQQRHHDSVFNALLDRKPVSAEVLKDYPDMLPNLVQKKNRV